VISGISNHLPPFTYFSTASSPEKIWVFWTSFNSFYANILYKVGVLEHHLFFSRTMQVTFDLKVL
jgi:hypothetical protein